MTRKQLKPSDKLSIRAENLFDKYIRKPAATTKTKAWWGEAPEKDEIADLVEPDPKQL